MVLVIVMFFIKLIRVIVSVIGSRVEKFLFENVGIMKEGNFLGIVFIILMFWFISFKLYIVVILNIIVSSGLGIVLLIFFMFLISKIFLIFMLKVY